MSLPTTAARTAVSVPRDALMIRQNHSYVLRVTPANTVEQLDVSPGAGMADAVEFSGPLTPGDRLVIRGGEHLAERLARELMLKLSESLRHIAVQD